jgi:hypothetical protein
MSYIHNNPIIKINPSDYSGANYELAMSIAKINAAHGAKTMSYTSSHSIYGVSSSDSSDSIQASSSGSHMTHCYFGNHTSNYVTITRG